MQVIVSWPESRKEEHRRKCRQSISKAGSPIRIAEDKWREYGNQCWISDGPDCEPLSVMDIVVIFEDIASEAEIVNRIWSNCRSGRESCESEDGGQKENACGKEEETLRR